MSHHTIGVRDVSFAYPDGTQALDGVSFEVGHGEAIAVIGANGAGKSTLLLHLNGLLTPEHGAVDIGGIPVTRSTLPDIRRTVGMVFQDPDDQLFMPTVAEDVGFGPLNLGLAPEDVAARVSRALARVGAGAPRGAPPYHLSGGEKRAVAIATVLAMEPRRPRHGRALQAGSTRGRGDASLGLLEGFEHTRIIATPRPRPRRGALRADDRDGRRAACSPTGRRPTSSATTSCSRPAASNGRSACVPARSAAPSPDDASPGA